MLNITAIADGEVVITASTKSGDFTATATVIVSDVVMLIAPNPSSFVFYVYFYFPSPIIIAEINIYDAMGRLVKTFSDPASVLVEDDNYRLLADELPAGLYFIEGITSKGNYRKQAVKE